MYSEKMEKLADDVEKLVTDLAYQQALRDHGIAQQMTDIKELEGRVFVWRLESLHQKMEVMEQAIGEFFELYNEIGKARYVMEGLFGKQPVRHSLSMLKNSAKQLKKVIENAKAD